MFIKTSAVDLYSVHIFGGLLTFHVISDSLVLEEALAGDDGLDEIPEAFILAGPFLGDLVDARAVAAVVFTADGIGEQLLGQATGEGFVLQANQLPELGVRFEALAARELTGGVYFQFTGVLIAPSADGVVVLQGEARRVDLVVTLGASGVRPVFDQLFPQGGRAANVWFNSRHVIWRWRRGIAQEFVHHVNSPHNRRGVHAIGRGC